MKNIINKKDVEYVARLSRLKIKEDEKQKFVHQLNTILGYIEKLNKHSGQEIRKIKRIINVN